MKSDCKVIAIANQKGGVGKTTTTEHLGIGLAQSGKRVLLVDLDPQANLTSCLGWRNVDGIENTVCDIIESIINKKDPDYSSIILSHDEGVDLIPSNINLSEYDTRLAGVFMREKVLDNGLKGIKDKYDYILIDCQPTLGILTINAIVEADEILIPVQPQFLPAIGMSQLVGTIEEVKNNMKPDLKYAGIVFTVVDTETNIAKSTIESVKEGFGKHIRIYDTIIPKATKVSETPAAGESVYRYQANSKAAIAYKEFTSEFIEAHKEKVRDGIER